MVAIQIFNTDYWDYLFDSVIAANGYAAFLWFILSIVLLSYYLANLFQAVVALSYQVEEDPEDDPDKDENVKQKQGKKLRFVFDPWKLRNHTRESRTRSLLSVKNVTEKKLGVPTASTLSLRSNTDEISGTETDSRKKLHEKIEKEDKYEVASRPPSAIPKEHHAKFGFWDRNPVCCFKCCLCFFPWLRIQHYLMIFVTDPFFDLFITATIIINTISMASYYHGISDEFLTVLNRTNDVIHKSRQLTFLNITFFYFSGLYLYFLYGMHSEAYGNVR